MNLWAILTGDDAPPPQPPEGRSIRCRCGRRIGVETVAGAWLASYDHSPAGAADVVVSTALEDFEVLAKRGDRAAVDVIPEFLRLSNPGIDGDLSTLAAVLPRLKVPSRELSREHLALERATPGLRRPGGPWAPAGCGACRSVYDAREVMSAGVRNKRGDLLAEHVVDIRSTHYAVPADALPRRVDLYRHLSAVLTSEHSAS